MVIKSTIKEGCAMTSIAQIGSQPVQRLLQFRAKPGAELLSAIEEAVLSEEIRAGVIVSGLGALKKAVFRNLKYFPRQFPVTPSDRLYLEIFQPMELVSLTGWIAPKSGGGTEIHAHFSASLVDDDTVVTLGGHLTRETICGIKVVVAILAVAPEEVVAATDPDTQTHDLFLGGA
jgi:predicted DNA-binding protein with PD1-like motif